MEISEVGKGAEMLDEDDDEHASKEELIHKYFIQEWNVIKSLIEDIISDGFVSDMSVVYSIRSIVEKYQEQSQLIEPYLENIISPLMLLIRRKTLEFGVASDEVLKVINPLCIIIYSLVTTCGHKTIVKVFPHQVSDVELAVGLLDVCHNKHTLSSLRQESTGEMEAKCVILLWLSVLVLVPFDFSSVDSSFANGKPVDAHENTPMVLKLTETAIHYLSVAGPMCPISAMLLSRLMTRPDMSQSFTSFIQWIHGIICSDKDDAMEHFQLLGVVRALAALFKVGSRNLLFDVILLVWDDALKLVNSAVAARSPLRRKLSMKLVQRIGLTCLLRHPTSWHYVQGRTSFSHDPTSEKEEEHDDGNGGVIDFPDIVEGVIDQLLSGLRDTDTIVRWSAAKGIGRVTSSLTSAQSDDVLSSVLELFSPFEGDGSWHGGCLALAELSRRGLLLPVRFPQVVPVVIKALHYDVRRGAYSVGSHVRDAAAYVCWAFGRAYARSDMTQALQLLSPHLLTVACYDREVNCRRAAAAAFQENVGRQGCYPDGIDIVTSANYFSLSSRPHAYLTVAAHVSEFEGFLRPFVCELHRSKITHWDRAVRELASRALSVLVRFDPNFFAGSVLDGLIPMTVSPDLCARHGAVLAVAEIVIGLHQRGFVFDEETAARVVRVVRTVDTRGKGGELVRLAALRLIQCASAAALAIDDSSRRFLLDFVNDNIGHPSSAVQDAAVAALEQFVRAWTIGCGAYADRLDDPDPAVRRGCAMALGVLPYVCLVDGWRPAVSRLCSAATAGNDDPEARACASRAAVSVCVAVGDVGVMEREVVPCLLQAAEDYSVDNRGDVGSWVREAALSGLERCVRVLCGGGADRVVKLVTDSVRVIVRLAVEKLDRLREAAARSLSRLLRDENVSPCIPMAGDLPRSEDDSDWTVASILYSRFVRLLGCGCYSRFVLSGLVTSTGGLQDSVRKASVQALTDYIQAGSGVPDLPADFLWVLRHYSKCDRVVVPTLKTMEILMSKGLLDFEAGWRDVLQCVCAEMRGSKNFRKLHAGMSIVGYLASAVSGWNEPFSYLLSFLVHRFPKIRKCAAEQVYLVLLEKGAGGGDLEGAVQLVMETCWEDDDVDAAKQKRLELIDALGLHDAPIPAAISRKSDAVKPPSTAAFADENASYSSMVAYGI